MQVLLFILDFLNYPITVMQSCLNGFQHYAWIPILIDIQLPTFAIFVAVSYQDCKSANCIWNEFKFRYINRRILPYSSYTGVQTEPSFSELL